MRERNKKRPSALARYDRAGYVFVLPWVLGFLVVMLEPLIRTVQFSFNDLHTSPAGYTLESVGAQHFLSAFTKDASFPKLLAESVLSMLTDVPILLTFSFFAAVLLREGFRGSRLAKGIFFLTVILSSGVFVRMQNETMATNSVQLSAAISSAASGSEKAGGIAEYLIEAGIDERIVSYLQGPVDQLFSVMTRSGIQIFIFLAGMSGISPALYEACSIEGATGWETFWLITFPMTSPLIPVNLLYSVIDSFMAGDDPTLRYIYEQAFGKLEYGYASALSWVFFLVVGLLAALSTLLISRRVVYHA